MWLADQLHDMQTTDRKDRLQQRGEFEGLQRHRVPQLGVLRDRIRIGFARGILFSNRPSKEGDLLAAR
jgi:hypothetical protein